MKIDTSGARTKSTKKERKARIFYSVPLQVNEKEIDTFITLRCVVKNNEIRVESRFAEQ